MMLPLENFKIKIGLSKKGYWPYQECTGGGERGLEILPYKSVWGACRKKLRVKHPQKVPESCFMGMSQIHFHPLEIPIQQKQII